MKNAFLAGATLVAALALPGCPIYPDEATGCYSDYDCMPGYRCDAYSGVCYDPGSGPVGAGGSPSGPYCTGPADCGINETCTASAVCRVGDCSFPGYGCVQGYACSVVNGMHACVLAPEGAAGSPGAGGTSGSGGIIVVAGSGGADASGSAGDVSSAGDSAGGVSAAGDSAGGMSSAGDSAGGVSSGGVSAAGASAGGAAGNPAAGGASQAGAGGSVGSAGAPAAGAGGAPSVAGAAGSTP